jgi:hypothetical protein
MPGEYTTEEMQNLSPVEFAAAKARNWRKTEDEPLLGAKPTAEVNLGTSVPGEYGSSWAAGGSAEYDFVVPSGERCRMKELEIEHLLQAGILDDVSRLEGLADELIERAEGAPPQAKKLPSREEFADLLRVINVLVTLAVVKPHVHLDTETDTVPAGSVAVSRIALEDRAAIMERALKGLRALDRFRNAG